MPDKYRVSGARSSVEIACGQTLAPGATSTPGDVDSKHPHDARLIESGVLVKQTPAPKAVKAPATTTSIEEGK